MSDKAEASAAEDRSQNSGTVKHDEDTRDPVKMDPRGLPLSPQPTDDPKDPLNWNRWLKLMVLAEVSLFSFLALFSASLIVRVLSLDQIMSFINSRRDIDPGFCASFPFPP